MKSRWIILCSVALISSISNLMGQSMSSIHDVPYVEETIERNEIVHHPALFVVGIDCRISNAPEDIHAIPKLWERFYREEVMSRIPNKVSEEVIAVYCDYEGDHTQPYSLIIGCPVSSVDILPEGIVARSIPASTYTVFRAVGESPGSVITTWEKIWKHPHLERTYTHDFELYNTSGSSNEVEIYIGVRDNETDLLRSVMQGRMDTFCSSALCSPLDEADLIEEEHSYRYAWGMDYACANGVIEKEGDRIPSEEEIDRTITYFSSKHLPFMWWTSAKILETKGFQFGGVLTGIALDLSERVLSHPAVSDDLEIQIVETDSELKKFTELAAHAFAINPTATKQWLPLNDIVMKKEQQVHWIAYLKGVPVGTVTLSVAPSSAGIWNLATLPEYRKHGIGGALVHAALVEAKKRDYHHVMAILMPKGMAWGLFTKIGFKAVCEFPFYVYGVSPEALEK